MISRSLKFMSRMVQWRCVSFVYDGRIEQSSPANLWGTWSGEGEIDFQC